MKKGKIGVLPETISVATAAEFLGGPQFVAELLHRVADGDLFSWTHGPSSGPLREKENHRLGTREVLPRITLDTPPEMVVIDTKDLEGAFYQYEVPWPPGTGKASSWDGAAPLDDLVELATSRKSKEKRAPWTSKELGSLWNCFVAMGGRASRGAAAQLARELGFRGYTITTQTLGEQLKRAESQSESSGKDGGSRASIHMQNVWPATKPGRK